MHSHIMDVYLYVLDSTRLVLESFDISLVLCSLLIIGVIGAFLRKISSSSKHPCTGSTSKTSKSNLKSSPQQGKRQGSVTFAEGTKFDELAHQDSVGNYSIRTYGSNWSYSWLLQRAFFYLKNYSLWDFLIFNLYCKVELGKGGLGNGRERIVFEEIKSYVYTGARELGQENWNDLK